jgi:hypothetical protein
MQQENWKAEKEMEINYLPTTFHFSFFDAIKHVQLMEHC